MNCLDGCLCFLMILFLIGLIGALLQTPVFWVALLVVVLIVVVSNSNNPPNSKIT